jgi:predicted AAA+ superfamily ATPase
MSRKRFFNELQGNFFLFGPRGTGKSTWLKARFPGAIYVDLLLADEYTSFVARPDRLVSLVEGTAQASDVVIDEVQRVPQLLPVVHHLIERDKRLRFILTGSSARKLKRAGTDLLAGRALLATMHPYMAGELGNDFSMERAVSQGTVPIVVEQEAPGDVLKAYVSLYVKEEVIAEGLVRNAGAFARFLEAAALSHGTILNVSSIARECQVERKVVENYLSILDDLHLGVRIPVFTSHAKRRLVTHAKYYLFDAGVYSSLRPRGPLDSSEQTAGGALEGLVMQHLRAWIAYGRKDLSLMYWRARSGLEVDFVLYGADGFHAIEVKNASRVRAEDLRGLNAFGQDYPQCSRVFLYGGAERLKIEGILCLPVHEFLRNLDPQKGLVDFA